jgi:hypothetical protein
VEDGTVLPFVVHLEGKKNDKSFEDRERKMVDLKSFFFNTLYHWVVALNFPNLLGFHDFLDCFYFSN